MSTRTDYPAAHSMDTTWFAVDRDGHVAAFESGEAGAVPKEAYLGEDYPPLDDLPVTGEAVRVAPVPPWRFEVPHTVRAELPHPAIFHLRDEGALAAEVAAGTAVRVPSEGAPAFRVEQPDAGLVARLHGDGAPCLAGCAPSPRFASLDAGGAAAHCSYTRSRAPLRAMTHAALLDALAAAPLAPCGGSTP